MPARSSPGPTSPGYDAPDATDRDLARGPARLCKALDLDLAMDGAVLGAGDLRLELGDTPDASIVSSGPRVGLRGAPERPWRYWLTGERTVSDVPPRGGPAPGRNALTCGNE